MNWKTHESNISFHKNKQVDDKIPLPQAIWNDYDKLMAFYDHGYEMMKRELPRLEAYLEK